MKRHPINRTANAGSVMQAPTHPGTPDLGLAQLQIPLTQEGDLWLMGRHRVLCAPFGRYICIEPRLMHGERAQLAVTTLPPKADFGPPPAEPGSHRRHIGEPDPSRDEFIQHLAGRLSTQWTYCEKEALQFECVPREVIAEACEAFGYDLTPETLQLPDDSFVLFTLNRQEGAGHSATGWEDGSRLADYARPAGRQGSCIKQIITSHTASGGLVFDIFAGSGHTLEACEATGRVLRGVEPSPGRTDQLLQYWQERTGEEPVLEHTGWTLSEVIEERVLQDKGRRKALVEAAMVHLDMDEATWTTRIG